MYILSRARRPLYATLYKQTVSLQSGASFVRCRHFQYRSLSSSAQDCIRCSVDQNNSLDLFTFQQYSILAIAGDKEERDSYDNDGGAEKGGDVTGNENVGSTDDHVDSAIEDEEIDDDDEQTLKPREIVAELERHIVGQSEAKRSVAIALRNRWRRLKLDDKLKNEVQPKNILMIGPTGCGKTEIARRLAGLAQAPFVKVEATKFTEVGFHGRDVDKIISDLVEVSINLTRNLKTEQLRRQVQLHAEEEIMDSLTGPKSQKNARDTFREMLRSGQLEESTVEVNVPVDKSGSGGFTAIPLEPMPGNLPPQVTTNFINSLRFLSGGPRKEKKKMKIHEARHILEEAEMERLLESNDLTKEAIANVEEKGIVFIDEIDKICNVGDYRSSADASAEGVQRDLLPLIEGCVINTKYGNVNTDHILFIASGAFHSCNPSDLLPELQGRLPIRVELDALSEKDLYRILKEPEANLIRQQIELLRTEGTEVVIGDESIRKMAQIAAQMNTQVENIGARRLHTIVEKIIENISFEAPDLLMEKKDSLSDGLEVKYKGEDPVISITPEYVEEKIGSLLQKSDLERFIL